MKYFALWAPLTWNPERLDGFSVLGDETMALKWYENISLSFSRHLWSWVAIPRSHGDINALLAFVFFFEKAIGELEVFGSKMIENMKPESLDGDFHGILSSIFRPEDHPFAGTQFADNICAVSSKYATSEPSRKVMAYKAEPASILLAASKAFGLVQGLIHFRSIVDAATKMGLWRTCSLGARLPARCRKTDEKGLN